MRCTNSHYITFTFKLAGAPRQNVHLQKVTVQFMQTSKPNITNSDNTKL